MLPDMDDESLRAIERDGRKGWLDGPCLWLDYKRFAVGSVNGKLRRPDSEIAALKPVVYAADMTDEPVHPHAAAKHKAERPVATAEKHAADTTQEADKLPASPNGEVQTTTHIAGPVHPSHPAVSYQNIQDGAEMDAQANKPDPELTHAQSMEQAKNADESFPVGNVAPSEAQQPSAEEGAGHATKSSHEMNVHESLIHDMTTKKMQDESVSVIPSNANGSAKHDELLVASDPTKGLVLETEKLNINGQIKPQMERFVTAVEEIATANGSA
jgi:hypothetical protein